VTSTIPIRIRASYRLDDDLDEDDLDGDDDDEFDEDEREDDDDDDDEDEDEEETWQVGRRGAILVSGGYYLTSGVDAPRLSRVSS
jgi:hypothetical protein